LAKNGFCTQIVVAVLEAGSSTKSSTASYAQAQSKRRVVRNCTNVRQQPAGHLDYKTLMSIPRD